MSPQSSPGLPAFTSLPSVLSPVSPKPLHYPVPSNIPVLAKQTDLGFNQTEAHTAYHHRPNMDAKAAPPPDTNGNPSTSVQADPSEHVQSAAVGLEQTTSENTAHHGPETQNHDMTDVDLEQSIIHAPADAAGLPVAVQHVATLTSSDPTLTVTPSVGPHLDISTQPERHDAAVPEAPQSSSEAPRAIEASSQAVDYQALLDSLSSHPVALSEVHTKVADDSASPQASSSLPSNMQIVAADPSNESAATDLSMSAKDPSSNPDGSRASPSLSSSIHQIGNAQNVPSKAAVAPSGRADASDDEWTTEENDAYEQFLTDERAFIADGKWEQFPHNSRLFVGDLHAERATKRDVFRIFSKYGKLAQIAQKPAYGFIQYLTAEDCGAALQAEQGRSVRGRKINLEISKPQKNRNDHNRRRSRSRDRSKVPAGVDRYVSGEGPRQGRGGRRQRDDYRPARSPHRHQNHGRDSSRNRHGRRRSRSRERSPHNGHNNRGDRYRDPLPRREEAADDELPLPRRLPRDVPDLQVIVTGDLDRNFISWIERAFVERGVRVDVLLLSPRLSEAAVVRRQILEGVLAVSRVDRMSQQMGKMPLQVFDRRGGADVRFEEYADLEPTVATEIVLRAKASSAAATAAAAPAATYGYEYGSGGAMSGIAPGPVGVAAPDLSQLIGSMDANGLQQLLGAMQQPRLAGAPSSVPLAQGGPMHQNGYGPGQTQMAPPGGPGMANILARLGSYQQR